MMISIVLKIREWVEVLWHSKQYAEARRAVEAGKSREEFIEEAVTQILKTKPKHHIFVVKGNGTTKIEELPRDNPGREELPLNSLNGAGIGSPDELDKRKAEEVGKEIARVEDQITEKREELEKAKDELNAVRKAAPAHQPIRKDIVILIALFITLSIAELWPLVYFIGPWFGIDTDRMRNLWELVPLLPIAIGVFAVLVGLGYLIISPNRGFAGRIFYAAIYLTICFGLSWMRAIQCNDGVFSWGLLMVFVIVVAGIPLVAAWIKHILGRKRSHFIEIYDNKIKKLENEERKLEIELTKLERERDELRRIRDSIGREMLQIEANRQQGAEAKKDKEYAFLRVLEAKLVIYRRAYDYQANLLGKKKLMLLKDYQRKGVIKKWQEQSEKLVA